MQSIWLIHLVASCCVGARDFAFGRMDRYLIPFYKRDLLEGIETRESARVLFAHFFMKCNEITGTSTHNFKQKPIPCVASKQYLMLGGCDGGLNELSQIILEAAAILKMPEPVISARLSKERDEKDDQVITSALKALGSQIHFFNDEVIIPELLRNGVAEADAIDYGMVGCCRLDLPGMMDDGMMRSYIYHNAAKWLLAALNGGVDPISGKAMAKGLKHPADLKSVEAILRQFAKVAANAMRNSTLRIPFGHRAHSITSVSPSYTLVMPVLKSSVIRIPASPQALRNSLAVPLSMSRVIIDSSTSVSIQPLTPISF